MSASRFRVLHAFVSGRVQGVFFRHNTQKQVQNLEDITGYVKNLSNGRVEVYAEGPNDKLKTLLSWLEQGPRMARVDDVDARWHDDKSRYYRDFDIN